MTEEQIKNWRQVLCLTIGPYAFLMPEEEIIAIRDRLQRDANMFKLEKPERPAARKPVPKEDNPMARLWQKKLAAVEASRGGK